MFAWLLVYWLPFVLFGGGVWVSWFGALRGRLRVDFVRLCGMVWLVLCGLGLCMIVSLLLWLGGVSV